MLSGHFLIMLSICFTASALNIPKHDTQLPLLPEHEGHRTQSQNTRVLLALRESESDVEHHVEIPLHTPVFSGRLHQIGSILACFNKNRQA